MSTSHHFQWGGVNHDQGVHPMKDGWMDGWMDDKWSGNSFVLGFSSHANHGVVSLEAFFFFTTYLLTTHKLGSKTYPLPMIYLPSKKTYLPTYLPMYTTYFPTYLPMYMTYFLTEWVLPRWNPILTQLVDVHSGAPHFRSEVKHCRINFDFRHSIFILTDRVKRGPPVEARGQMEFFVPFVFSLVFGLVCFDRIVWYKQQVQRSSTLVRKILNLVVVRGPREPWEPKVWAFVVNQKGQNLHHDQAFFSPHIYIYIYIYFNLFIFYF